MQILWVEENSQTLWMDCCESVAASPPKRLRAGAYILWVRTLKWVAVPLLLSYENRRGMGRTGWGDLMAKSDLSLHNVQNGKDIRSHSQLLSVILRDVKVSLVSHWYEIDIAELLILWFPPSHTHTLSWSFLPYPPPQLSGASGFIKLLINFLLPGENTSFDYHYS